MYSSMRKMVVSELAMWIIVAIVGLSYLYPLKQSLRFGSDLVGGVYLTLKVQTDKAIEAELLTRLRSLNAAFKKSRIIKPTSKKVENNSIVMTFESLQALQEATRLIKTEEPKLIQTVEGTTLQLGFDPKEIHRLEQDAVQRNIEVLRKRLDKFSVAEIPIAAHGDKNIVVELPNVSNTQAAKDMVGTPAQLEFRLVYKIAETEEELLQEYDGDLPEDQEILSGHSDYGRTAFYLVQKYPKVIGKMLKKAQAGIGGKSGIDPIVSFSFDDEGAEKFYKLTSKNVHKPLAIVLDREVISAPTINSAIKGGSGEISGQFTAEYAKSLASLLQSGAFVAPVSFEEERLIGPGLGLESRNRGLIACVVGLLALFLFSIYFYRLAGFFAFLALLFNLLLVLVGLSWLKATLTLPGIAGMLLTVGMAIDASILIYERIKEELRNGLSLMQAVKEGFSNAMIVILDANITTFIVGVVLYHFGSGPIQGFAVTMMLGIIATIITGIFFLRSLFSFTLKNFNIKKLSI